MTADAKSSGQHTRRVTAFGGIGAIHWLTDAFHGVQWSCTPSSMCQLLHRVSGQKIPTGRRRKHIDFPLKTTVHLGRDMHNFGVFAGCGCIRCAESKAGIFVAIWGSKSPIEGRVENK